jgi:guanylate kinase
MSNAKIIILSGPSVVGKNAVLTEILLTDDNLEYLSSYTTRLMRNNESQGKPYYFVSRDRFEKMIVNGEFIEHNIVHGNMYGSLKVLYDNALYNYLPI